MSDPPTWHRVGVGASAQSTATRRGRLATAALLLYAACLLSATPAQAAKQQLLDRPHEPIVLTGAQLETLLGADPDLLVAYTYSESKLGRGRFKRVPVQADERVVVDFGRSPFGAAPSGDATVYGTPPVGASALQYADPSTFVGADPDPALDADDEIAFMAADAGRRAPRDAKLPKGVRRSGATRVAIEDPLTGARGSIYLFSSKQPPAPAGDDYVSYSFQLASGDYRTTYDRGDGPNPEASQVSTDHYRAGFSDRWLLGSMSIVAGDATGAGILDGYKFAFTPGSCARSEATFSDAEGAFAANIDGPVRAIRSYVGANSGPYTERTHVFYRSRHDVITDLRVHAIPSLFNYYDLSAAATGMTYLNSANPSPAAVDGIDDPVSDALASWHLWSGSQGSFFATGRVESSFDQQIANGTMTGFYGLDPELPAVLGRLLAVRRRRDLRRPPRRGPQHPTPPAPTLRPCAPPTSGSSTAPERAWTTPSAGRRRPRRHCS